MQGIVKNHSLDIIKGNYKNIFKIGYFCCLFKFDFRQYLGYRKRESELFAISPLCLHTTPLCRIQALPLRGALRQTMNTATLQITLAGNGT